ncbi:MAG: hypothetical protein KDB82_08160 [Planctomycetes bacterium]|nr:hypothetical protein [Planctomycetota bacterium]
MKRAVLVATCLIAAGALCAQNANAPVDDKIDSPLEYYFGALALVAIVMTWAWLILKMKNRRQTTPEDLEPAPEKDS